mmetsp:Transcript_24929/g.57274  ORF Transcript_24929/g.57274 Transcript_24929/m.57274 type:complete len:261 (+) Transcript_24929:42-824(+)
MKSLSQFLIHLSIAELFLLASSNAKEILRGESNRQDSSSFDFDFYVLAMSFQPEFCYQHKSQRFPGCQQPKEFWRGSLTLHGLWPQDYDGSWPDSCTDENFNPQTVVDLGPERFNLFWPNVKSEEHDQSEVYHSFWEHEWTKHGTCTGLTQDEYFDTGLKHFLPTPDIVREQYGQEVSKSDLQMAYREENKFLDDDVILVCAGGKYLSEVRVCVAREKNGSGSHRIACIDKVKKEDNCHGQIIIPQFYVDSQASVDVTHE